MVGGWPGFLPLEGESAERWYNMRHEETSGNKESENVVGESFVAKERLYENRCCRDFGDKKEDVMMFFVCREERKERVSHIFYFNNCLCNASRLHGRKERRCNRKVTPLKQRFLTRCSRMAVSDAVCVI